MTAFSKLTTRVAFAGLVLVSGEVSAQAEYRLQAGDVLEVSAIGIPELKTRVPIQLDGSITLPIVGTLIAEGEALSDLQSRIQAAIGSRPYRTWTSDGREVARVIQKDDVSAIIVEYRPVAVSGDVAHPGDVPFRPHMMIRQAVAAAGGLPKPITTTNDTAGMRSDYIRAWLNLVRQEARSWRLKTALGISDAFDWTRIPPSPISKAAAAEIVKREEEIQVAKKAEAERQKSYLQNTITLADEQIKVLTEQLTKEREGYELDTRELNKARLAYDNGDLPSPRVADQRRAVLFSSTRTLQVTAQLMQTRKWRAEAERDLERLAAQQREESLTDLQDAELKASEERAKLEGAEQGIAAAGLRTPRASDSAIIATVFRKGIAGTTKIAVDFDAELQPGDVLEIKYSPDLAPGEASGRDGAEVKRLTDLGESRSQP